MSKGSTTDAGERASALWGGGKRKGRRIAVAAAASSALLAAATALLLLAGSADAAPGAKTPHRPAAALPAGGHGSPGRRWTKPHSGAKPKARATVHPAHAATPRPRPAGPVTVPSGDGGAAAVPDPAPGVAPPVPDVPAQPAYVAPELAQTAQQQPDKLVDVIIQSVGGTTFAEKAFNWADTLADPSGTTGDQLLQRLELVGAVAVRIKASKLADLSRVDGIVVTSDSPTIAAANGTPSQGGSAGPATPGGQGSTAPATAPPPVVAQPTTPVKPAPVVRPPVRLDRPTSSQLWPYVAGFAPMWPWILTYGDKTWSSAIPATPTIAVVDSGVDARDDFGGRLLMQVDLTTLPSSGARDGYGHGTFVAGIIAGNGAGYAGGAPTANIISIKVMDDHGQARTSDVIRAAQWILENKDRYNIRVANFSLHSSVPASFLFDPLDRAVEKLWFAGVTVVAASGNYGQDGNPVPVLFAPGNDPFVVTVGAADINNSVQTTDDVAAPWSTYGYTADGFAKPDLGAPGRYMVGPVPRGSSLAHDRASQVRGDGSYMQLSGTSFAAPVVSAAAALVLSRHPDWTPDQVKGALMYTARPTAARRGALGVGEVTAYAAAYLTSAPNPNAALDQFVTSGGNGSGPAFDAASWASAARASASWNSASWSSASWGSASWNSASWNSASWGSASWSSASWSTASWGSASWSSASWASASWGSTSLSDSAQADAASGDVTDGNGYAATDAALGQLDGLAPTAPDVPECDGAAALDVVGADGGTPNVVCAPPAPVADCPSSPGAPALVAQTPGAGAAPASDCAPTPPPVCDPAAPSAPKDAPPAASKDTAPAPTGTDACPAVPPAACTPAGDPKDGAAPGAVAPACPPSAPVSCPAPGHAAAPAGCEPTPPTADGVTGAATGAGTGGAQQAWPGSGTGRPSDAPAGDGPTAPPADEHTGSGERAADGAPAQGPTGATPADAPATGLPVVDQVAGRPAQDAPNPDGHPADAPAHDRPTVEAPTTDQPVTEAAVHDQPAAGTPPADPPAQDAPKPDPTPADAPAVDHPADPSAADTAPADQPTSDNPTAGAGPAADAPPTDETPDDLPAADAEPADQAPSDTPWQDGPGAPADQPASGSPPQDGPAVDAPPADETPTAPPAAGTGPADQPASDTPPQDGPAADPPPADATTPSDAPATDPAPPADGTGQDPGR